MRAWEYSSVSKALTTPAHRPVLDPSTHKISERQKQAHPLVGCPPSRFRFRDLVSKIRGWDREKQSSPGISPMVGYPIPSNQSQTHSHGSKKAVFINLYTHTYVTIRIKNLKGFKIKISKKFWKWGHGRSQKKEREKETVSLADWTFLDSCNIIHK